MFEGCSAVRFEEPRGSCLLCKECSGDDSLEHYAVCPFAWSYLPRKVRISELPKTIKRFLVLEHGPDDELLLLACHVYAVFGVVNLMQARQTRGTSTTVESMLWERWRAISGRSRVLQRAIRARWQQ